MPNSTTFLALDMEAKMDWVEIDNVIWMAAVKMWNKHSVGKSAWKYRALEDEACVNSIEEEIATAFVLHLKDSSKRDTSAGITYNIFLKGDEITGVMRARLSEDFKSFVSHQYQKIKRKKEILKENMMFENKMQVKQFDLKKVIDYAVDGSEDKILVLWQMDLIETEEAMEKLGCSQRTLYRKWYVLKEELKQAFNVVKSSGV